MNAFSTWFTEPFLDMQSFLKWLNNLLYHRATDKARKSVITHWKLVKTHLKNKQGVKIRISISRYALGVRSSAYWLAKLKLWIDNVHLSVHLSTYCQSFPFLMIIMSAWYYKNKCLQYNTTSNSKILPNLYLKYDTKLQTCASKQ